MELWNSVWNELCANVGRTTTKMDAHFVPQFFKFFAGSEHSQGPLGGPHACSTSRFSLSSFLRHGYNENVWRSKRCNVEHQYQFCRQNLLRKRNRSSLHTNLFKVLGILSFER